MRRAAIATAGMWRIVAAVILGAGWLGATAGSALAAAASGLYSYPINIPSVYRGGDAGVEVDCVLFDGKYIWVGVNDNGTGYVRKLNSAGTVLASAQVGIAPLGMTYDGTKIWVTGYTSSDITIVSAAGAVIRKIGTGGSMPEGIQYDGKYVWVANNAAGVNTVSKYDAASMQHLADYPVGQAPDGFAFDGTYLWVTNSYSDTVMKLDRNTGEVLRTYPTGSFPLSIIYDGKSIWVGNGVAQGGSLSRLRALGGVSLGSVTLGNGVRGLAFDGSYVWACNSLDNTFSLVDANSGSVVGTYGAGRAPRMIAYDGARMWIANSAAGTLTVVTRTPGSQPGEVALQSIGPVEYASSTKTPSRPAAALASMLEVLLGDN
jgi:YVTN family beta-propeller protein